MPCQSTVGLAVCNLRPSYLPWGLAPCCATRCSLTPATPTPTGLGPEDQEEGEQGNRQAQSAAG